jgi:tripartite-type tricarboxylate transporter receptor subunit TctC
LLARHIGKHIPGNPTVIVKNMGGAASLRLAKWLYQNVGRQDVRRRPHQGTTIGGNGPSDDTVQFPRVLNAVVGTKFKVISGYPGGNDVLLAMERGEVQGRCGWSWSSAKIAHQAWIDDKKINVLIQLSLAKHPDLPDVPLITDFATSEEQKQISKLIFGRQVMGRPFLAPPGVPADRAEALRRAFMDTMSDREFLADAESSQFEITPVSGERVQMLVKEIYGTPTEIGHKAAAILQ